MPPLQSGDVFLKKLKQLSGTDVITKFATACGQQQSNMTNYLSGKLVPGDRVLKSCLENLFSWPIEPIAEVEPLPDPLSSVTDAPGVYVLYDHNFKVIYVGQANNLRKEVQQTLNRAVPGLVGRKIKDRAFYYSLYKVLNDRARHNVEQLLIRICGHETYNTNVGNYR
jgi:hypothetical protein